MISVVFLTKDESLAVELEERSIRKLACVLSNSFAGLSFATGLILPTLDYKEPDTANLKVGPELLNKNFESLISSIVIQALVLCEHTRCLVVLVKNECT